MKQVFQDLKGGATHVEEVPLPSVTRGHLVVRTAASLISAGTERMLAEFGKSSYIQKARQQPDKVREALDKTRTDGVLPTVDAVRHKLGNPLPMGYANAGYVEAVGPGIEGFKVGDLVASNGPHAEYASVPVNLAAKAPSGPRQLEPQEVAFGTVGAIALQSVRLAAPTLGERFVVMGLGLVGLITVQLLRASGCHVLGIDPDDGRASLARRFGAEAATTTTSDPVSLAAGFASPIGVDGVIVAAATRSSSPIHQAAQMSRKRGRVVLVGVTGLDLDRAEFYEKELTFQVSCSYGPGRYDPGYEQQGNDYPPGFVRWTSARNQQAVLEMIADGRIEVAPLVSHSFPILEAGAAYEALLEDSSALGIVIGYPKPEPARELGVTIRITQREPGPQEQRTGKQAPRVGLIGSGQFAQRTLLPAVSHTEAKLAVVGSRTGTSAATAARRFGFEAATSDIDSVIKAPDIDTIFIATRHDSHAELTVRALNSGKNVFVEKPLAVSQEELDDVIAAYQQATAGKALGPALLVGFNRRFAPQAREMRSLLSEGGPMAIQMTVNAGSVPADSWLHHPEVGGGRIVGEACHFVDFARHLVGHPLVGVHGRPMLPGGTEDTATISLSFKDGSLACINYFANGHSRIPKERIEAYSQGRVLVLKNFRRLRGYGFGKVASSRLLRQDKGHAGEVQEFVANVGGGQPGPIPFEELVETTAATFLAAGRPARWPVEVTW